MEIKRIYSWNPLGKAAKKADDAKKGFDTKVNKWADKFRKMKDFVTDNMDEKTLQDFVSKQYGKKVKVGQIKKVKNPYGGMFKYFAGIPETKEYVGGYVFRNGNDVRLYPEKESFKVNGDPKDAQMSIVEWFDSEDDAKVAKFR